MQRFRYIPPDKVVPHKRDWPHAYVLINLRPGGEKMLLRAKAWCDTELTDKGTRWDCITIDRYMFVFRDQDDAFMFRMANG